MKLTLVRKSTTTIKIDLVDENDAAESLGSLTSAQLTVRSGTLPADTLIFSSTNATLENGSTISFGSVDLSSVASGRYFGQVKVVTSGVTLQTELFEVEVQEYIGP